MPININKLKRYRLAAGFRYQARVAHKLGITRNAVNQWESGVSEPNKENLHALAVLYRCRPQDFEEDAMSALKEPTIKAMQSIDGLVRLRDDLLNAIGTINSHIDQHSYR